MRAVVMRAIVMGAIVMRAEVMGSGPEVVRSHMMVMVMGTRTVPVAMTMSMAPAMMTMMTVLAPVLGAHAVTTPVMVMRSSVPGVVATAAIEPDLLQLRVGSGA